VAVRTGWTPVAMAQSPTQAANWYLVNRTGYIYRYQRSGQSFVQQGIFANAQDRVLLQLNGVSYGEMGLLGLAFHPRFADNGFVFIYYSAAGTEGTPVEARLSRVISRDNGLSLDMASEEILLRVPRTTQYHWGGTLGFGPDGMLYAGFGEGNERTKSPLLDSLLGKMIRIDVDRAPGYRVPAGNPFVGQAGARPEIYAKGFRNPWKWSFNAVVGSRWLGDVGA
jgi:glucose/arabinose dehydrogenase